MTGTPLLIIILDLDMENTIVKKCSKCNTDKVIDQFQSGKRTHGACKECRNKDRKALYIKYKENANTIVKICKTCNEEKDGAQFNYAMNVCKKCQSIAELEENNKPAPDAPPITCNKCNVEKPAPEFRSKSRICRKCETDRLYVWRENNKDQFLGLCKKYRDKDETKAKRNAYLRQKYLDESVKIKHLYRCRIRGLLKQAGEKFEKDGLKGVEKYEATLGCTFPTLRKWIEFNFKDGMTWENFGSKWHLDHVTPCASFDMTNKEHQSLCFHWSNLQPLDGIENIKKSAKIDLALITHIKARASQFLSQSDINYQIDALPEDLKVVVSRVLDTKLPLKDSDGSGERPEVQ